jgi:ubiquinone/menaquinone biosynthesis C-methylase UbiE
MQADLAKIVQIEDGCIDVIGSDAVFEHLKNLQDVLKEFYRILAPGGVLYATFGPLWYGYGGDHVSGYDQITSGYNHLILPPKEYQSYLQGMGQQIHSEDDGRTWIEHDLFSRLKPSEYLSLIESAGFQRLFISAIVDPRAVECIHDPKFNSGDLLNIDELDLVISGMTIIYRKLGNQASPNAADFSR